MAKINYKNIKDFEEYIDSTQVRGFRKSAAVNNSSDDLRMDQTRDFVSGRTKKDHIISLRRHEREMYNQRQENKRKLNEARIRLGIEVEEEPGM